MKLQIKMFGFTFYYGTVGEETPIVDKNGTKLKVGDLVICELKRCDGKTFIGLEPIVYHDGMCFVLGARDFFNEDGNYDYDLVIEKQKSCEDINANTTTTGSLNVCYVDEEREVSMYFM